MNKYAIIKIGPFQYNVQEGVEYTVPRFEAEEGKKMEITDVLAVGENEKFNFGKPVVANAKVTIEILEQGKGEKVVKQVFKAKVRYRKKIGHRILTTKFKVVSIK